jgi:hypothetical protein
MFVEMTQYKCRVECPDDVRRIKDKLMEEGITLKNSNVEKIVEKIVDNDLGAPMEFPDREWNFSSETPLETLREVMKTVVDAHVAVDTLEEEKNYTGER